MIRQPLLLLCLFGFLACQLPSQAPPSDGPVSLDARLAKLEHRPGLLELYVDRDQARVYALLPPAGPAQYGRVMTACLYVEGLASGLGSNPVGLDRGQIGDTRVVTFRRLGPRVLIEQPNLGYRARSENPAEAQATQESFATSVLWSGKVEAEDEEGYTLVDLTSFLVRDAHGSAGKMRSTGQGSWRMDAERSVLDVDAILAFPDNLEFDALLTFSGDEPGGEVRSTAPTSEAVTLVQHHSFVRLPDRAYEPRALDTRMGHFGISFLDYAAPIADPNHVALATRHRLQRTDPSRGSSPAIEPIVYYVDPGAPEPIRSALVEGASWWAEAFTAAGFEDAFRVEVLPEGVHPLDVRYNVIQWVHRSTRGWSYGGGVVDPRTGEMIKGHVNLGSLRVRQDRLLFEGLVGTEKTGSGAPDDPVELALARIRQLSAHEVGHTLGLSHNFTASTYGRASVMDYPAPLVTLENEVIDVSQAYDVGVGAWDVHAIRWLYSEFPPDVDEARALAEIAAQGQADGLLYHSDSDARGLGAALPTASLWDNGADPVNMLEEVLDVRERALELFGERNLAAGRPRAELEEVLVPLYFHHRYQLHAAAKSIGGIEYHHALIGDRMDYPRPVSPLQQQRALAACLRALSPATLDLPESVLSLLGPRPPVDPRSRERFARSTGAAFDSLGAARTGAELVVELLFEPSRCARLLEASSRDANQPTLSLVLTRVVDTAFGIQVDPRRAALAEEIQHTVLDGLLDLADHPRATPQVRAAAERILMNMSEQPEETRSSWDPRGIHFARIQRFLQRDFQPAERREPAAEPPPGSPIGSDLCGCALGHL